jgi:hypothetical protein
MTERYQKPHGRLDLSRLPGVQPGARSFEAMKAGMFFAPYVGELTNKLLERAALAGENFVSREGLERTALTDLFIGLGADFSSVAPPGSRALRVAASIHNPNTADGLFMTYQVLVPEGTGAVNALCYVDADARFGFVNVSGVDGYVTAGPIMTSCVGPLEGGGNLAFVPGVEEALRADIRILVESTPPTSQA